MKNPGRWFWLLAAVALVGAVLVVLQGRELRSLAAERDAIQALSARASEASRPDDSAPAKQAGRPLTSGERLELMNLRRQVTELAEVKRRAPRVADENAALRAQSASISNRVAAPFAPGWVRRSDARRVGFATPEAAFESFIWALQHRDTNTLFQALEPEMHETLRRNWNSAGAGGIWNMASRIPGFVIRNTSIATDGTAKLEVEVAPGVTLPEVTARQVNNSWRLRVGWRLQVL